MLYIILYNVMRMRKKMMYTYAKSMEYVEFDIFLYKVFLEFNIFC